MANVISEENDELGFSTLLIPALYCSIMKAPRDTSSNKIIIINLQEHCNPYSSVSVPSAILLLASILSKPVFGLICNAEIVPLT